MATWFIWIWDVVMLVFYRSHQKYRMFTWNRSSVTSSLPETLQYMSINRWYMLMHTETPQRWCNWIKHDMSVIINGILSKIVLTQVIHIHWINRFVFSSTHFIRVPWTCEIAMTLLQHCVCCLITTTTFTLHVLPVDISYSLSLKNICFINIALAFRILHLNKLIIITYTFSRACPVLCIINVQKLFYNNMQNYKNAFFSLYFTNKIGCLAVLVLPRKCKCFLN